MLLCLLDTNVLSPAATYRLDGIDWVIYARDEIHIIVPDTVNRESIKLKKTGRSRTWQPL